MYLEFYILYNGNFSMKYGIHVYKNINLISRDEPVITYAICISRHLALHSNGVTLCVVYDDYIKSSV